MATVRLVAIAVIAGGRDDRRMSSLGSAVRSTVIAACTALIITAIIGLGSATALAQGVGSVGGRVTDSSGAAAPGASVVLVNTGTGSRTETQTGSEGTYVFPNVMPGRYRVDARLDGFRPAVEDGVAVHVATRTHLHLELRPGPISEAVVVEATSLVDRTSPAVGTLVDRQFIENLPLNGRSFHTLLELTPGVTLTRPSILSPGQFSVNGQRGNGNYFTVDGVGANVGSTPVATFSQQSTGTLPAFSISGGTNTLASADALEEFKVQTSSYAAEFGRNPGGQVSLATRSGTNTLTGSVFEYYRHDAFDANTWFNNRDGIEKLPLEQHQYGGTLAGPVRVPGYDGRGRTFFFLSYEGLRLTQPQEVTYALVPSREARQRASGVLRQIYDSYPLGNTPSDPSDPLLTERYRVATSYPSRLDATSVRIDQQVGAALRLFGRVNHAPSATEQRAFAHSINRYELGLTTATVGATWTLGPRVVSDTRLNYSASRGLFSWDQATVDGAAATDLSGLFPGYADASNARISFQPMQSASFAGNRVPGNFSGGKAVGNAQQQFNLVQTTTVLAGAHEVKAGVDYRRLNPRA
ncbi:MAG TPA: carboxypeptidase-like regulatory domain-containing protein, partial [Luteitalea sp.]|nr:carboxypeptidase-like regulatory domain-containing protein [Luteitalea sp.]